MIITNYNATQPIKSDVSGPTKLINNVPIFNYASFYKQGINLFDPSINLGGSKDYYGWLSKFTNKDTIYIYNKGNSTFISSVSLVFNKYSCGEIRVYLSTHEYPYKTLLTVLNAKDPNNKFYNESGYLPLYLNIPLNIEVPNYGGGISVDNSIVFDLFDFHPDARANIQGLYFGNIINITDILDYNSILEINPIGDDLALNETNMSAVLLGDFKYSNNQSINFYDESDLLETDVLIELSTSARNISEIKTRNVLQKLSDVNILADYLGQGSIYKLNDWNDVSTTADAVLSPFKIYPGTGYTPIVQIDFPEWFKNIKMSYFINAHNGRKLLQQICWATCCGITTQQKEHPTITPFRVEDKSNTELIIYNKDDRILETEVIYGEIYSSIDLQVDKYIKNESLENLGSCSLQLQDDGYYVGEFMPSSPVLVTEVTGDASISDCANFSPYYIKIINKGSGVEAEKKANFVGYRYKTINEIVKIPLNDSGKVLSISNQFMGIDDLQPKIAQLKKWYTNNNTLKATIVDNESELKLGMLVNIQLEDNKMFKGLITKLERNNISTYHTVKIEVHEWN